MYIWGCQSINPVARLVEVIGTENGTEIGKEEVS